MLKLEELTWQEIDGLPRNRTVVFIPIGPIEEHGPHLPVATDFLASYDAAMGGAKLMEERMPELIGVVAPVIPLGTANMTKSFPGTISIRPKAIEYVIADFCAGLARHGFKYIVVCNQHLSMVHLRALRSGMRKVERRYGTKVVEPLTPFFFHKVLRKCDPIWQEMKGRIEGDVVIDSEIHADVKETSYMMYSHPQLVKEEIRKTIQPVRINPVREMFRWLLWRKDTRTMGNGLGYVGSPALATSSLGELYFQKVIELYAEVGIGLYRGVKPQDTPRLIKAIMKVVW
jgi:creatinine amidohydrolase